MAEPLAILGATASVAGLLGFLVSTIEKLAFTVEIAKHSSKRLRYYNSVLKNCQRRLQDWERNWAGQSPTFLWGEEGAREIEQWRNHIFTTEKQILKILHGSQLLSRLEALGGIWHELLQNHAASWLDFLRREPQCLDAQDQIVADGPVVREPELSTDLFSRVALALYQDKMLIDLMSQLGTGVDGLLSTAKLYNKMVMNSRDPERATNQAAAVVQDRADSLHLAMESAYRELGCPSETWALLCTFPNETMKQRLEYREQLELEFLQLPEGFKTDKIGRRVTVQYPLESRAQQNLNLVIRKQSQQQDVPKRAAKLSSTLKDHLSAFARFTKTDWQMVKSGTLLCRARTALCIATWATMGWHAHWMNDLCSCRIRHAVFDEQQFECERVPVFSPGVSNDKHLQYHCSETWYQQRPHLMLALALAELALIRPVSARNNTSQPDKAYCVWDYGVDDLFIPKNKAVGEKMLRNLDKDDLAYEVGLGMNWRPYREAVTYCLSLDKDGDKQQLNPGAGLREYTEHVVEPLTKFYKYVEAESDKQLYRYATATLEREVGGSFF